LWRANKAARVDRRKIKADRRSAKKPRRNDWMTYVTEDPDDWDDVNYDFDTTTVKKGTGERKVLDTTDALDEAEQESVQAEPGQVEGLVVEIAAQLVRVRVGERELLCYLRGVLSAEESVYTNVVAVGDRVYVREGGEDGQGVVELVLPRTSVLARPDVFRSHVNQVIVANAEQLLIVASWREPKMWLELVDRYLISAAIHKLTPIICVNKVDLAEDMEDVEFEMEPYEELGYRIIYASALAGDGVEEVRDVLRDKLTVLAGLSGVGKSSLLSAVEAGLDLKVAEVSDYYRQGRHTTTQVTMHPLEMGGFVVDTPGIREFGLSGLFRGDLAAYYPEFQQVGACQFPDCVHMEEPDCAVKAALESGEIIWERYENYIKIYETLPEFTP
jgi:ribosome biogenesis GTPase / thiamine phosphate phosphatase